MVGVRVAVLVAEVPQSGVAAVVDAHERLGHEVRVVHLGDVGVTADSVVFPDGVPDVCHSRASAMWGLDVQSRIECVVPIVNTVAGQWAGRDKWVAAQKLYEFQVPTIATLLVTPNMNVDSILGLVGEDVVMKPRAGHSGVGVLRLVGGEALSQFVSTMASDMTMVAQPFVRSAAGVDFRVMVLEGQPLYALERRSVNVGEFRTNTGLGGRLSLVKLHDRVADVASRAAIACGLDVAGVDVTVDVDCPAVIEVNTNAGLGSPVHLSSGVDVGLETARLVERRMRKVV